MDVSEFIQGELDRIKRAITRTVADLSPQELKWQPGAECNSIGLILFHELRSEDTFIQGQILGQPQVWETEKWYQKLNMSVKDNGSGYTPEQIAAFPVPELKDLMSYAEAVRARTIEYLKGKTNDDFNKVISMPWGDTTIGAYFALVVVHLAQHIGDISYLRGMQRGLNK